MSLDERDQFLDLVSLRRKSDAFEDFYHVRFDGSDVSFSFFEIVKFTRR